MNAQRRFLEAREYGALGADDLGAYAGSAWWLGLIDESVDAFRSSYALYLDQGQPRPAAIAAVSIGYALAPLRAFGAPLGVEFGPTRVLQRTYVVVGSNKHGQKCPRRRI